MLNFHLQRKSARLLLFDEFDCSGRSARLSLLFSFMGPLGIALGAYTREDGKSLVFQLFSAFVAGILLFQTAATKLPLEIRGHYPFGPLSRILSLVFRFGR